MHEEANRDGTSLSRRLSPQVASHFRKKAVVVNEPSSRRAPGEQPGSREEPVTAAVGPEEALVADLRGSLRPAQVVEEKLLALLRTSHAGPFDPFRPGRSHGPQHRR